MANINFATVEKPKVLIQITSVNDLKPKEDITGVCTSLEEWAFYILKPKHQVQLSELVETDSESGDRFDRAHDKNEQEFEITTTDFTSNTNDHETEIDNLEEHDTYTSRSKELSSHELAHRVEMLISQSLEKAKNQLKNTKKKIGVKEREKIMQTYNATSAFATIMSSVLEREELFMDYNE